MPHDNKLTDEQNHDDDLQSSLERLERLAETRGVTAAQLLQSLLDSPQIREKLAQKQKPNK